MGVTKNIGQDGDRAGRNMALNMNPLNEIFKSMGEGPECAGCGNEMEDAIKNGANKDPIAWPLLLCYCY